MNKNSFMWAQGNNANILEPVRELAENGWQHRDIPKASNMNWIFNQIAKTFEQRQIEFETFVLGHNEALKNLENLNKAQKETIDNLKADFFKTKTAQENINKIQKEIIESLKTELIQTKKVQENLVRGTSRALFTLNAHNLNTKLHPAYPFDALPEPLPMCLHCKQHHEPEFDCRRGAVA